MTATTRRVRVAMLAALLGALFAAPLASAQTVWRLAGSFNAWNTMDDDWAMSPVPGSEGEYELFRIVDPGRYVFKFVRDGSWSAGHFGRAEDGTLEQPGRDLVFTSRATALYRITLDTRSLMWSVEVADVDEPVLITHVLGQPSVGRTFMIDASESLIPEGASAAISVSSPNQTVRVTPSGSALRAYVTSNRVGPLVLDVTLGAGADEVVERLSLEVEPRFTWRVGLPANAEPLRTEPLLPVAPGVHRALVEIPQGGLAVEAEVRSHNRRLFRQPQSNVAPGLYGIEVRDGAPMLHNGDFAPRFLLPGNWVKFTFSPPVDLGIPDSVHLLGDFNGWARPGSPKAVELVSRVDGTWETIIELPQGAFRFQYLVNDAVAMADPRFQATVPAPYGGEASIVRAGPQPSDYADAMPDNINLSAVLHNPRYSTDLVNVSPGLGLADVTLRTLPGDVRSVDLIVRLPGPDGEPVETSVPMARSTDFAGFDRYTARVMSGSPDLSYVFSLRDGRAEYMSPRFDVTLDPDPLRIPDWAKGAVWYQIFAERFRNGNPLNDPHGPGVFPMAWNAHWYRPAPGEAEAHLARHGVDSVAELGPPSYYDGLFHWVWSRRYGGDLQGVVEKLDELADLGVTAIYFNPVFEADTMHKYDATDFRHIDDNFGAPAEAGRVPETFTAPEPATADPDRWGWTAADRYFLDVLLPEARARGIRVVIDGVFNHTGREFWAFKDVQEKGADSEFADWFFAEYDEDGNLESWTAWDGPSGWLPKFLQEQDRSLVEPVKRHIFDITARWMDPNGDGDPSDGIDGWRLDVPLDVGLPFWAEWREHVKSINPDAIIIAEIWDDARETMQGEHFDTQMHYPFAMPVLDWLGVIPGTTSDELIERLELAFDEKPQVNLIHQNLFASHDTDRYVSMLYNPGRSYDQENRIQDGDDYKDTRPSDDVYELSLLGVAIQATYLGAPMIYYGDEVGMWGADDPTDRKPYPWPDTEPNENPDDVADMELRERYAEWFRLRGDPVLGPVLRYGALTHLRSGDPGVFAYVRSLNGRSVLVVVNRNTEPFDATPLLPGPRRDSTVGPVDARYWLLED